MCGITGKLYFDQHHHVNYDELKKMTDSIIHRGPDDEGYYIKNNVGLGFRRLSIIDLKSGHQPLSNFDKSIWITFNGEIYNFKELKSDLLKKGYKFRTNSDTEVIVNLYEEYGENCVHYLRGMFAFVIWDERQKQLFGARDRFGIKPFYYYIDKEKFVWGSEIKAINKAKGINKEIDLSALDLYLTYGYITHGKSIFTEIKKLPQAHYFTIDLNKNNRFNSVQYWDIYFQPDVYKTEEEWLEVIDCTLSESVKLRLMSDVPLGAFLSGGIDSSSIVALMSKYSSKPVKTFSIGFKESKYNELHYARQIAERYKTDHHEMIVEPESIELLPKLVKAYDEPFADSSAIPTYYVSKFAREYVTVVLSGDGGDELFAGYNSYLKLKNIYRYNIMPHYFNKYFWGGINNIIPHRIKGKGITYFLSKNKNNVGAYFSLWTEKERSKLYKPDILQILKNSKGESYKKSIIENSSSNDFITKMQELDMRTYLVDDILTKVDRVSMQNSLEVRVPILDHKFAELSFQIPSNLKLKGNQNKYILTKAMSKYLPQKILTHKKHGFSIPLRLWFKDDLKDYINNRLNSGNNFVCDYLNNKYISKITYDHNIGQRDFSQKIWSLLFLDLWLENNK